MAVGFRRWRVSGRRPATAVVVTSLTRLDNLVAVSTTGAGALARWRTRDGRSCVSGSRASAIPSKADQHRTTRVVNASAVRRSEARLTATWSGSKVDVTADRGMSGASLTLAQAFGGCLSHAEVAMGEHGAG